jgi:hypothetical protein
VSVARAEPHPDGPAGAQRWALYLDWLREEAIGLVLGLDPSEHRVTRLPSGWSPLEMLSHLLHREQRTRTVLAEYARHGRHLDVAAELSRG